MRCRGERVVLLALLALGGRTAALSAQTKPLPVAAAPAWAVVTYLSGGTVYLEVGSKQGIKEGTVFTVVRSGVAIGELTASYVSSSRTACAITRTTEALVVGDSVRYLPVAAETVPVVLAGSNPAGVRRPARRSPVRGRIGLRYLSVSQGGYGNGYNPPAGQGQTQQSQLL